MFPMAAFISREDNEVFVNGIPENDSPENKESTSTTDLELHRTLRPRKSSESLQSSEITKMIRSINRKEHRSLDDDVFLEQHKDLVKLVETRKTAYNNSKERLKEVMDDDNVLRFKVAQLAQLLSASKHAIVYTGAGISTSANIPDYRGVDGVWTRLSAGLSAKECYPTDATPTYTHMAISTLAERNVIKYVTSQNCDGLHLRSGVLNDKLSELHGNMYAELCTVCGKSFYRVFDVTENTRLRFHKTNRHCDMCQGQLIDTIVHFGERSASRWPHNWTAAELNAEDCDLILCLGSSLKVLRSYKKLWLTDRKKSLRPKLCIVNNQWTPKDSQAQLKINGKTDEVMRMLMDLLSITVPSYLRHEDPIFKISIPLRVDEQDSYHTNCIEVPENMEEKFTVESCGYKKRILSSSAVQEASPLCSKPHNSSVSSYSVKIESTVDCLLHTQPEQLATVHENNLPLNAPAWFGKGCRKLLKKKAKLKRRKTT